MLITNDYSEKIPFAKDFYPGEFWEKHDFEFPDNLIEAAQILRDFFGVPLSITCTYPGIAGWGFHIEKLAEDLQATKPEDRYSFTSSFRREVMRYIKGINSDLIESLRKIGITGFGLENSCVHLDDRAHTFNHTDQYGQYMVFEYAGHMENGVLVTDINRAI